jgi:hypothetical protein
MATLGRNPRFGFHAAAVVAVALSLLVGASKEPPPESFVRIYAKGADPSCNPIMVASNSNPRRAITVTFIDTWSSVDVGGAHNGQSEMMPIKFLPTEEKRIGCATSDNGLQRTTNQYRVERASY